MQINFRKATPADAPENILTDLENTQAVRYRYIG